MLKLHHKNIQSLLQNLLKIILLNIKLHLPRAELLPEYVRLSVSSYLQDNYLIIL